MRHRLRLGAIFSVGLAISSGQLAPPSFEVATIRPTQGSLAIIGEQIEQGKLHVGISIDRARVNIGFLSIGDMIPLAYRVLSFQVKGPEWINKDRWDVVATIPEGVAKEQVPEMLQALLADRFHLQIHEELRETDVYGLLVKTDGPRFRVAPSVEGAPIPDRKSRELLQTSQGQVQASADNRTVTITGSSLGSVRVTMPNGPADDTRVEIHVSMQALADLLSSLIDKPVVNMTELEGIYEISLELPMDDAKKIMQEGLGIGMLRREAPQNNEKDPRSSFFKAIQKLGLRLEPRKSKVQVIVVDHLEKRPTEN